ncbi:MAG: 23S rRNA (pseudouridine(1915)-N(3))-methyltransferase RlmH [Saprospiraceae bacterium]|nr:23S rRNA (pseudouridine(1915)-N(3))-methyltransferase RlmH [Saprospiraceae bacterium]MCB9318813.1 23S rRNA (pseudouridine(1915)-N(3))-methyltransferase RlmH [Lewinellaceae bacterium]
MAFALWAIGKQKFEFLDEGIEAFSQRIRHYYRFDYQVFHQIKYRNKNLPEQIKSDEWQVIESSLKPQDMLILLDEKGKEFTSVAFAGWLEKSLAVHTGKRMVFLIGGAYGFSPEAYARADQKLSLSRMTYSHLLARLIFTEQLYRACTIIRGESYHNE